IAEKCAHSYASPDLRLRLSPLAVAISQVRSHDLLKSHGFYSVTAATQCALLPAAERSLLTRRVPGHNRGHAVLGRNLLRRRGALAPSSHVTAAPPGS